MGSQYTDHMSYPTDIAPCLRKHGAVPETAFPSSLDPFDASQGWSESSTLSLKDPARGLGFKILDLGFRPV